ncbi:MAG: glycosyltransferase family 2 protein [Chitinophagales bacterium]
MEINNTPTISISVITYNQENFIAETINGILSQKINFSIEIIITDDNSTDNTAKICREFASKNNNIIFHQNETNIGLMKNFVGTLDKCSGKYIAICEGDDYWTDVNKLQKQVDFLEGNESFVACFHEVSVIRDNQIIKERRLELTEDIFTFADLAKGNFVATLSLVFRNIFKHNFPSWIIECKVADYPLILSLAQHGKFKYFKDIMGVYRHQPTGSYFNSSIKNWIANIMLPTYVIIYNNVFEANKRNIKASILKERMQLYKIEKKFLRYLITNIKLFWFTDITGYSWKNHVYYIKDYFIKNIHTYLNE